MTPEERERFDEMDKRTDFLELVGAGTALLHAAVDVGWTPAKLKKIMQDREFAELVQEAEAMTVGSIEMILIREAKLGRPWAVQMYLFNRAPERWRPPTARVEVKNEHTVSGATITAVKQSVLELLESVSVKELQSLPSVIDVESVEIELRQPDDDD